MRFQVLSHKKLTNYKRI